MGCPGDMSTIQYAGTVFTRFTQQVPRGHPIILLKSNKFNMAVVSVKWSIGGHNSACCTKCTAIRPGYEIVSQNTQRMLSKHPVQITEEL